MTDFVITGGVSSSYPLLHYGCQMAGSRATYCLPQDFITGFDANVLAIPNLQVSVLSSTPITVSDSFFGMSVQNRANDALPGITAKVTRSHDLKSGTGMWKYIETSDGVFNWANIDSWVNTHYAAGRDLVFTLYGTPTINASYSARPTELCAYGPSYLGVASEPSDMTKWSRFCTQVATQYKGKIKYYEIWNEPNYKNDGVTTPTTGDFYFSGTFATLSQMTRLANQAIKAVDPTAKIISPPITVWSPTAGQAAETWFTTMMAAADGAGTGGTMKDWVDIIGVHLYTAAPNRTQDLPGMIDRIKAAMVTASVSGKEIWDTESAPVGTGNTVSDMTDPRGGAIIARSMFTMAVKGVARTIYYQYDHGTMGIMNRGAADWRESMASVLKSGAILNAYSFTDGRIAYTTASGLVII
jgi:hypothetical protein